MAEPIRAKRKATAKELAKKFGVSPRTIQNYMALPRAEWEAANTISRNKPWEALGMSRASWYNKGKPTTITSINLTKAKPWEVLGMSRASWYNKGKPLEAPVKPKLEEVA